MERLSGLDASFLYLETPTQLLHVCGLLVLDPSTVPGGYSFGKLKHELFLRTRATPAFRRKLHDSAFNMDHPVWIDDADFDIDRHLHRTAVPAPGDREQLAEACAHIAGQPLDRKRPLWEFWVIEGLADGKIAVMTKMHHASVDGVSGANLMSALCGIEPDAPRPVPDKNYKPLRAPSDVRLAAEGLGHIVLRPLEMLKLLPGTVAIAGDWIMRARRGAAMPPPFTAPRTSFNGTITGHRSIAYTGVSLAEVKEIKEAFGNPWLLADEMPKAVAELLAAARKRTRPTKKAPAKKAAVKKTTAARRPAATKTAGKAGSAQSSDNRRAGSQ